MKLYVYLGAECHLSVYEKNKYGMKLFVFCDSATSYVYRTVCAGSVGGVDISIQVLAILERNTTYLSDHFTSPLWVGMVMKNRKVMP